MYIGCGLSVRSRVEVCNPTLTLWTHTYTYVYIGEDVLESLYVSPIRPDTTCMSATMKPGDFNVRAMDISNSLSDESVSH